MANAFYNRGASFNPDELADGDAIEAEFDSVSRGFDTIENLVDLNKAGYPSQTFHVAPATETTHAVPKAQMDTALSFKLDAVNYNATDILSKLKTVDGSESGLDADYLDGLDSTRFSRSAVGQLNNYDNWDTFTSHGTYKVHSPDFTGNANAPPSTYGYGILQVEVSEIGGDNRTNQVYYPHNNDYDKYIYQRMLNGGIWTAWSKIWRGGTDSGSGLVAERSRQAENTAPIGDGRDLIYGRMGGDDFFRLRIYSDVYDNGQVELATADGGNEPIYVRQYDGVFSSVRRTLELLDAYGITKVPVGVDCTNGYGSPALGTVGNGICGGNGDNCNSTVNNLKVAAWWGIGFGPSVSGQPVPYGEYSHWFNARNGDAGMRGSLSILGNIQCNGVLSSGSWLSSVAVLTGLIGHGGTLPIPSGFSEGQCAFFVSPRDTNSSGYKWDLREDIPTEHYSIVCFNSGRTANGFTRIYNDVNDSYEDRGFYMNYLVIGVK